MDHIAGMQVGRPLTGVREHLLHVRHSLKRARRQPFDGVSQRDAKGVERLFWVQITVVSE